LQPEPEDADKIKKKLAKGLTPKAQARVVKKTREASRTEPPRKPAEGQISPATPALQ
jgi:hypothetical protein